MSSWAAKRFWKQASVDRVEGGFAVRLDARPVKTPAKAAFVLPTQAMAAACALEWDAQTAAIKPDTMPMTRYANSAIDKVAHQFAEVAEIVAAYGGTDLLCYRAPWPAALSDRQAAGWDPLLRWADEALGAPLEVTAGVTHKAQPTASLARLSDLTAALTPFQLAGLHDLVAISGSLVLGLAVAQGRLDANSAFDLSRIDEHWQAEEWGQDEDAAALEQHKREAFSDAARFFALCAD